MTDTSTPTISPPSSEPASKLLTFLIADIRGYTRFTQDQGDEAAARLVTKFARLLEEGVRGRGGHVRELRGDEALVVFGSARQALRSAVDLQMRFARESQADPSLPLPVGMGIDAGEAVPFEGGYRGEALNLAARLCNLASQGEILASEGVVYLGRRVQGVSYAERGLVDLKGFADPVRVIRVIAAAEAAQTQTDDDTLHIAGSLPRVETHLPIGGFLGALPTGELIGREAEWDRLMAGLDVVAQGTGRLLTLAGEPGIGKTRLAQEVTLKARHWGFLVATGRCYEQEQAVPFYPFQEALVTIYNACPPDIRADIPRRWPHLGRLLPDQIGPSLVPSSEGGEDQQRLFRAVTHLFEAITEEMPIALLLDDLHWADDSSLKLLQHLARYTVGYRVLLLGTYRDVELHRQHPLESALLDLGREQLVEEIAIRRLDQAGTSALVAEIMGATDHLNELAALVHRRTEGNAFFIQEMLRALIDRGDVYRRDGHWELRKIKDMEVPKSVRSVIGQRVGQLGERAQEILREASVLGQTFAFDDVMALGANLPGPGGWTEDEIEDSLEQATGAGLVRESGRDSYAYNHALTQQALYAELSTRRRKRLHLAAGKALERLPERERERRAAELAFHFLEGDDAQQAFPYAMLAGDRAEEVFANGEAERQYRTALELAREMEDRPSEAEALEKLAGVLTIVARYDKALELLEQAVELHHAAGDQEAEGSAVAQMGHIYYLRGTYEEGIARLEPMIQAIESDGANISPAYSIAALYASLARLYADTDNYKEQLRIADRAMELARAIGDIRLLLSAEVTRSSALWRLGLDDDALQVMEDLIPRAEAAGDLINLTRALGNTAVYYARRGEFEKDRLYHERALAVAERRGDRGQIVFLSMALSANAYLTGDWGQARLYLDRVDEVIHSLGGTPLSTWPKTARGWLALREGDLAAAASYAEEILAMASNGRDTEWQRLARRLLAEKALLEGRPETAWSRLEPVATYWGSEERAGKSDAGFLWTLAWVHLEMGNRSEAQDLAARAVERATRDNNHPELVEALVVHGMVMSWESSWDEAERLFSTAQEVARSIPFPFGEARALYEWGMMHALHGEPRPARKRLKRALTIFQRLGARKDAERTDQSLAVLPPVTQEERSRGAARNL